MLVHIFEEFNKYFLRNALELRKGLVQIMLLIAVFDDLLIHFDLEVSFVVNFLLPTV